ncbi:MAG TPA: CYTH and CHAD domain-containing protein [Mycobacteriales bacterium]|nr:CYTH and CHAD domain-containing protein [Mycobacteriales bacterium]
MTPATSSREVEAKFRVHPPFEIPDLLDDRTGAAAVDQPIHHELRAVYWDTSDLRLAREGITLRHRSGEGEDADGWHLKLPVGKVRMVPDANAVSREEIRVEGQAEAIPEVLRGLVLPWSRTAVLGPVATLVTNRTAYMLRDVAGASLVELTDDLVSVVNAGHVALRFREIEVEDKGGGIGAIEGVGGLLRASGAVGGEFVPKVVRALGPQASADPDPPLPGKVGLDEPARCAVRDMLRRDVRRLIALDTGVRRDAEDAAHQMRVTARRLRSVLKTFRPLLDPQWAGSLRRELAWLADSLSTTRDSEVLLDRLMRDLDALPEELVVGPVRARLEQVVRGNLTAGRESIDAVLSGERYIVLLERLVDAGWEPFTSPAGERPTGKAVPRLVRACWNDLREGVQSLDSPDAAPEAWHKVRIEAKRLRYSCEAASATFGRPAHQLSRIAAGLQDSLGENQDATIAADLLRVVATARGGSTIAFTLGLMHARQTVAGAAARAEFRKQWKAASRAKSLDWLGD